MSINYKMTAANREAAGKGISRSLRREGRVPAVIYGDKKEPVKISLDANDTNVTYNRGHMMATLCDLDVDGTSHLVLARDVQLHPVKDTVEHIDFLRVTAKTKIAVEVPVHVINEETSIGIKAGGILNLMRYTVELYCSATDIPAGVEIDIAEKDIGDTFKMSDAKLPEGTKPVIDDRDFTIGTIDAPREEEEEEIVEEGLEGAEGAEGEEGAEGAEGESSAEEGGDKPAEEASE